MDGANEDRLALPGAGVAAIRSGAAAPSKSGAVRHPPALEPLRSAPVAHLPVTIPAEERPILQIVVDTEEEFDWTAPFRSDTISVCNIAHQGLAQRIFDQHGARPTYVVDFPVASQPEGYTVLRAWLEAGRCEIGTHLQPWVNPPFEEVTNEPNSFPGNLPPALERGKLAALTDMIEANFGTRPVVYRAGRYGIGPSTAATLIELGYEVDSSVLPGTNFTRKFGPDFRSFDAHPFWYGKAGGLLSIPLTVGNIGVLARSHAVADFLLEHDWARRLKLTAIASRLGVFAPIRLTPEGYTLAEQKQLVTGLVAKGHRIFNLSYHSSSLLPGATEYVRTEADRDHFLANLSAFLDFFRNELHGVFMTSTEIRKTLLSASA